MDEQNKLYICATSSHMHAPLALIGYTFHNLHGVLKLSVNILIVNTKFQVKYLHFSHNIDMPHLLVYSMLTCMHCLRIRVSQIKVTVLSSIARTINILYYSIAAIPAAAVCTVSTLLGKLSFYAHNACTLELI